MAPAPFVLLAAGFSGAAALVAQLLWMRTLGRVVGSTPVLDATAMATFVLGLGLGALAGSRVAPRSARPARISAIALVLAGIWIAASPWLLDLVAGLAKGLDGPPTAMTGALLGGLVVLIPAVLFGSIFPFLVRSRVVELPHAAGRSARLYASQILGAGVGAVVLFLLLPGTGEQVLLRYTGVLAAAGALLLLIADRPLPHGSGPPPEGRIGSPVASVGPALAVCVSGVTAIGAEAAWLEILEPLAGSQPVALTIELALVVIGLALGLALGGRIANRLRRADLALGTAVALAGYLLILPLPLLGDLPTRLLAAGNPTGHERTSILFLSSIPVLVPVALCLGVIFPLAVRVRADWTGSAASAAGRMYAWDAAGHVLGAVLVGLMLGPALGADGVLMCLGFIAVAVAAGMRLFASDARRLVPTIVMVLPLLIWLWPGVLDSWRDAQPSLAEVAATRRPMPSGLVITDRDDTRLYAATFVGSPAKRTAEDDRFAPPYRGIGGPADALRSVSGATDLVRRGDRIDVLAIDPSGRAPTSSMALGLLPALLHVAPERALVVGFGAGWSTHGVLAARLAQVDVAETHPCVLRATDDWFGDASPLGDSRVHVALADGRSMLRAAHAAPYHVVAARDADALLTVEGLATLRAGMTDDGVAALLVKLGSWDADGIRSLFATVRGAFDHVQVWRFHAELVVVVSPAPLVIRSGRWRSVLTGDGPGARLARTAGLDGPAELVRHFALDTPGFERVAPERTERLVDGVPRPARLHLETGGWHGLGALLSAGFPPQFTRAIPDASARNEWLAESVARWLEDDPDVAAAWFRRARIGADADSQRVRGDVAKYLGGAEAAARFYDAARRAAPTRGDLAAARIESLPGLVIAKPELSDQAIAEIDQLGVTFDQDGRVLAASAVAYRALGQPGRSRVAFEAALAAKDPPPPDGTGLQLARFILASPPFDEVAARTAMEADPALYEDPDALSLYISLLDPISYAERSKLLGDALTTLERDRAITARFAALRHLDRLEFADAEREAVVWSNALPTDPEAWFQRGLASLARTGAQAEEAAVALEVNAARPSLDAFRKAIELSRSPASMRNRVSRILGWYGVPAGALEGTSGSGSMGN